MNYKFNKVICYKIYKDSSLPNVLKKILQLKTSINLAETLKVSGVQQISGSHYRYFRARARTFVSKWDDVMRVPGRYRGLRRVCNNSTNNQ